MDENRPFILGKIFNKAQYAEDLLNGKVFINPLAVFGAGELWKPNTEDENASKPRIFNRYRDDLNEGLTKNIDARNIEGIDQLIKFFCDIGGIPRNANSVGEIDSRFLTENVNCFSALFYDSADNQLCCLNDKMCQFADIDSGRAIVIFNVRDFLKRILCALTHAIGSSFWMSYGLVDYDYGINSNAETDEFTKEEAYSYQREFRLAINLQEEKILIHKGEKNVVFDPKNGTLKIDIGSIRDIAFTLPVKDYINFEFPNEYMWVKNKEPDTICPFYPPIKTEISYMCPIFRTNDGIYIGKHAMFPANRNTNTFTINRKRIIKAKPHRPADDDFFMSMLELYFRRSLDICKGKAAPKLLEQMLTGFAYYMIMLDIDKCAGITIEHNGGTINLSYEDTDVHDSGLFCNMEYDEMPNNSARLKPTDFAVLVTLSNKTSFDEYEYNGKKYVQIEVAENGTLPSGEKVEAGQVVWVEISGVKFIKPIIE